MDNKELLRMAKKETEKAYAPYSGFKVGAALLCADGEVFGGCNIENSSYSATVCAERVAIFKAISEGKKDFIKLAIVSSSNDTTYPCGICRQVMSEFMPRGTVVMYGKDGPVEISVSELLPHAFTL